MKKWLGIKFESSSTKTQQFKNFAKDFKKYIKNQLPVEYLIVKWNVGHFYISGMIINSDAKYIYFSIPDVRGNNDSWYSNILIRTASSIDDYIGGANQYTSLDNFKEKIR